MVLPELLTDLWQYCSTSVVPVFALPYDCKHQTLCGVGASQEDVCACKHSSNSSGSVVPVFALPCQCVNDEHYVGEGSFRKVCACGAEQQLGVFKDAKSTWHVWC